MAITVVNSLVIWHFKRPKNFKPGAPDECWLWNEEYLDGYGYGHFCIKRNHKTQNYKAHQVAWMIAEGLTEFEFSAENQVNHTCHVRRCVNDGHLKLGNVQSNKADEVEAGRHGHGETNPAANLTVELVEQMREDWATGLFTYTTIGEKYKTSRANAWRIINRKQWLD
jgi:hypothetical protein